MTAPLFNDAGLRAVRAAAAVRELGPLRYGPDDGQFWAYRDGVWAPADREVHRRIVAVLGDRYRPGHAHAIRDVLRSDAEEISVQPVSTMINFRNGMVHWDDPMPPCTPHDPAHGSTVQLPIRWAPGESTCEEFDAFLDQAVAEDDRARVWEILGYLMMSGNPLQRMFLLTGGGGNGKGVLMAVIMAMLGRANVSAVALTEFTDDVFATAELHGRLANICGDIDTTFIERTGLIKKLAGEDPIRAQRKYGQPFSYEWWGKALFSANGIPTAADTSEGWLRRWEIVNFPNQPAKPDRGLKARLTAPAVVEAIAVRAVLALRPLMHRGDFDHGQAAAAAHSEFAMRNNKLLAWVDDELYHDGSSWYPRDMLLRSFRAWDHAENPSAKAIGAATFYERLRQVRGVREAKIKGVRGFRGLRMKSHAIILDFTEGAEEFTEMEGAGKHDQHGGQPEDAPPDPLF